MPPCAKPTPPSSNPSPKPPRQPSLHRKPPVASLPSRKPSSRHVPPNNAPRKNPRPANRKNKRSPPAPSNRAPLLSTRNIILALCALAILTWLLPWTNTPLKSYLGASLNFRLLAWVNTIIFAATAAKVWLDDKQEKPTAYTELMLAAIFALLIHAQYYLRLKPFFERLGTPKEVLSYGIGLYAQIAVALLMLGYVLFAKKLDR